MLNFFVQFYTSDSIILFVSEHTGSKGENREIPPPRVS